MPVRLIFQTRLLFNYCSDRGGTSDTGLLIVGTSPPISARTRQSLSCNQSIERRATSRSCPGHGYGWPNRSGSRGALPFGEQVRNGGMEIARLYAQTDIRLSHPRNARRIIGNVTPVR
jgi:hypothetical protein